MSKKGPWCITDIELYCKKCKAVVSIVARENGPHIEAGCDTCKTHIKFLPKTKPAQGDSCAPNNMATGLWGSICLDDLLAGAIGTDANGNRWVNLDALAAKGKPFDKANNGKIYVGVNVWINDDYDSYQNIASIQLAQTKEQAAAREKKTYVGNLKYMQAQQQAPPPQQGYQPQQPPNYQQRQPQPPQQGYQQPPQGQPFVPGVTQPPQHPQQYQPQQPPAGVPGTGMPPPAPGQFAPQTPAYNPQAPTQNPWNGAPAFNGPDGLPF